VIPVRNFAQGAIDVSDGLAGDVEKLARVSHVGALIEASRVPFSPAAQKALQLEPHLLETLITAGDDYEIVAAVPEASAAAFEAEAQAKGASVTMIGRIVGPSGDVRVLSPGGEPLELGRKGFSHF
jgi:thiamine-monophosphate kinase